MNRGSEAKILSFPKSEVASTGLAQSLEGELRGDEEDEIDLEDPFVKQMLKELADLAEASTDYKLRIMEAVKFIKRTATLIKKQVTTDVDIDKVETVLAKEEDALEVMRQALNVVDEDMRALARRLKAQYDASRGLKEKEKVARNS